MTQLLAPWRIFQSTMGKAFRALLRYGALCCDGAVSFEDGKEIHIGDPTETSIILAAYKNGMTKENSTKNSRASQKFPLIRTGN